MNYIDKLYELGFLSFKTTNSNIIDELLECYANECYDNNVPIKYKDITRDNCSVDTSYILDKGEIKGVTALYSNNRILTTWSYTIDKDQLQDVINSEYYNKFYTYERC